MAATPSAPKKPRHSPPSPPLARLTPPAPHQPAQLRLLLAAQPLLWLAPLAAQPVLRTPDRPSAPSHPPNLQRARRRKTFGARRVLFPES